MADFEFAASEGWQPLRWLGLTNSFFTLSEKEIHVIFQTWIILGLILAFCLFARLALTRGWKIPRYLALSFVKSFISMCNQSMGTFIYKHFVFITSIFTFILFCNTIPIIPWMEEPTQNINTTLALSIISFLYVQYQGIRVHGILGYLKEYIDPLPPMAPLHVVGKIASIVSMAFRLFGNIFGGSVILGLWTTGVLKQHVLLEILGLVTGLNFLILFFFGIFEGFLQAFVFTMLSLTYLSIAISQESSNHGATA